MKRIERLRACCSISLTSERSFCGPACAGVTNSALAHAAAAFSAAVAAPRDYGRAKRRSRFAILIWLSEITVCELELAIPRQFGNGWFILERAALKS